MTALRYGEAKDAAVNRRALVYVTSNVPNRRLIIAAVGAALVTSLLIPRADAKRAPPPKSTVCNKTAGKIYVATINYAGRGHQRTRGWSYLKPGECRDFRDDGFYFRGKRVVTGLRKDSRMGCITLEKIFAITFPGYGDRGKAACAARRGRMVPFRYVPYKNPPPINVIR